ncbi:DUF2786 domain-containing protein [Propionibacteriaceae bacterium G57]|uniref:DUF2786 domain-containing protein n=1 Tax=Aestuariimicrobium sp. G57 TaxID=3418485 RepID=UPI003DA6FF79
MSDKAMAVIGKLLRKAEQTSSSDEADALMAKAQEWATKYSIDLARARYADSQSQARELVEERTFTIGRPRQRHVVALRKLYTVVAQVNDIEVLMRGGESEVYPIGMPSDLEATEALYRSLVVQMVAAADRWVESGEHRSMERIVRRGRAVVREPLHSSTARGVFYDGYIHRIQVRLQQARDEVFARELAEESVGGWEHAAAGRELSSTALALRAKSEEVSDFIAQKYPRVGVRRQQAKHAGQFTEQIRAAGRAAADRASLGGQQALPG